MDRKHLSDFSVSSEVLLRSMVFDAPSCLRQTNFLKLNKHFGQQHLETLYIARSQRIPEVRLHRLPPQTKLAVRADEDFIPYVGNQVLVDQIRPRWEADDIETAIEKTVGLIEVSEEVMLCARFGLRTWGHWLGELLPKVVCAEAAYPGRFRYIVPESIITDLNLRTMRQSLEAYGIYRNRLMLVQGSRAYRFSNLFAVSPVIFPGSAIHPDAVSLMRRIITDTDRCYASSKKIALLRRESKTRNISNIEQVSTFLSDRGWKITDVGELNFSEQVHVFACANNVISILGSGLTGLIFAPLEVGVITLAPSNWSDLFFFSLMQERRARLVDIRGESLVNDGSDAARQPFFIDPSDIEEGLRSLDLAVEPLLKDPAESTHNESGLKVEAEHKLPTMANQPGAQGTVFDEENAVRRAIQRTPDDLALHIRLVELLVAQEKTADAIYTSEKVLSIHPYVPVLRIMQDHLSQIGRYTEAIDYARREVELATGDAEPLSRLGHALVKVGNFDEAADFFERASDLRPEDAGLHLARSRALADAGRLIEATGAARAAIALHPREAEGRFQLARLLARQGQTNAAISSFRQIVEFDPNNAAALQALSGLTKQSPSEAYKIHRYIQQPYQDIPPTHKGIDYLDFFSILQSDFIPRTYFEIGTASGRSLLRFDCDSLCVDPHFNIETNVLGSRKRSFFFQMTSDEFFNDHDIRAFFPKGIELAFLDGLHQFEALLRDFINTERFCDNKSLVMLHDCLPLNERMAERSYRLDEDEDPTTRGHWAGDVWRILPILLRFRPDLRVFLADCPPTGLVLCSNLSPHSTVLADNYDSIVEEFSNLTLSSLGLPRLWQLFPVLDSIELAKQPGALRALLGLD